MAHWDDGYVTDFVYLCDFYREITPSWMAMSSLLLGHRPPDISRPFSYADLGCGHGFTALLIAASCPHADIWGFDFNPAHIEFANGLADRAGLTNVHFREASFADLANLPDAALPNFDFMVSHGVLSWVSPENQRNIMAIIERRLKPGGMVYLSYNVTTGWASMVPVQTLMRMLTVASRERTDLAIPGMLDHVDRLKQSGALFFQANPTVEGRLARVRKQDPRYIAHEFLGQYWQPLMFADVASEMAKIKCRFIGSATLPENNDSISVPANVVPLLSQTRDPFLRETLRDLGCAQSFRRDLYRKGTAPMPVGEHQTMIDNLTLAWTGRALPEGGVTAATPLGNVTGRPEVCDPLFAMLEAGPLSIRQALESPTFAGRPLLELLHAFTLLAAGGYAHPMLPEGGTTAGYAATQRLNLAIARARSDGADLPRLGAAATGSGIEAGLLETLLVGELLSGKPADANILSPAVQAALARGRLTVQRDGRSITDVAESSRFITDGVGELLERRVPLLRRLGVLPA